MKHKKLLIHEDHDARCNRKVVTVETIGANQPPVNIDVVIGLIVCCECRVGPPRRDDDNRLCIIALISVFSGS